MKKYDYVIVGSGLFGAITARELTDSGKSCLIIDKRNKIGGNVRTDEVEGINVHTYGPHIFHCNDEKIWNYVNRFANFNSFINRPKVNYNENIFSFPINLFTLYQLWGIKTPEDARKKLNSVIIKNDNPKNLEEWILSQVGEEIYNTFIYGYTKKQWGTEPRNLPASIIKRLPIRMNYEDNYYTSKYQGIPIGGYTKLMQNILKDIPVELNADYLKDRNYFDSLGNKIIYTGMIDEFFNYSHGELEYRSLEFKHEQHNLNDYQGNAIVNYTSYDVPYTRICEHKHFENTENNTLTVITKEYPKKWERGQEAYYPINDEKNNIKYLNYKNLIIKENKKYIFGGRLADYKYYDMHQVIGSALVKAKKEINL